MSSTKEVAHRIVVDAFNNISRFPNAKAICEQLTNEIAAALEQREREVRETEQERCAKIAETIPDTIFDTDHEPALTERQIRSGIAAAIRRSREGEKSNGK